MEAVAKILVFTVLGIALLIANAWYFGAVYHSIKGGRLVIAPISIVGGPAGASEMDEVLARMLLVRLRSIMAELEQSQTSLRQAGDAPAGGSQAGGVPAFFGTPRTVRLDAQLFEPAEIELKVAGVEVGGLLPRFQRWFVKDRTLSFTVSLQERAAIVAGNVDALGNTQATPIWIRVEDWSPQAIVDEIAFALIQRAWAKDGLEIGELKPEEFRTLMLSVGKVAEINRRVRTFKMPARAEFASVLNDLAPLAERITSWNELTYFAATVAEGAEDNRRALLLYRRMKEGGKSPVAPEVLEAKLKVLLAARENAPELSLVEYGRQAENAAEELGRLFGFALPAPPIELMAADFLNVFIGADGKLHAPPGVEHLSDMIVHAVAGPFVTELWKTRFEGQSGALAMSYMDVLTSIVKQAGLHQTAEQADWTIAPGGIAWMLGVITGKTGEGERDQRPLRSMKAPGTAYDDPIIGKDLQPAHMKKYVQTTEDNGGIHINSGIPNKAFYEAAMKIGTDKAGRIWVEALKQFKDDVNLSQASATIQAVAARLHGDNSPEAVAVQFAWKAVGL